MKTKLKNYLNKLMLTILLLTGSCFPILQSYASAPPSFTVKTEIPDNQIDERLSYFDLQMIPGQKQTLKVLITNDKEIPLVANIAVNNASTSTNGTIIYSMKEVQDESLITSMESIATVKEPTLTVEPGESVFAEIEVSMPKTPYTGVILGGILITADYMEAENIEETEAADSISIENKLAYVIGLKLTESDEEVTPNMNLKRIEPSVVSMRSALTINLQNSEAVIMKGMTIRSEIYKKGSTTILQEALSTTAEAAPNSNFDFVVDWNNKKVDPGAYRLKMTVTYEEHVWEWDEEFEISAEDSAETNSNALNIEEKVPVWIYIAIGILILISLMFFAFLLGKKRREKDEK